MNPYRRLESLRRNLADEGCDAVAIVSPANVAYLTGFERVFDDEPSAVCVVCHDDAVVYVDSRYVEAAEEAARALARDAGRESDAWRVVGPEADVWERALADVEADGAGRLALEDSVPHARFAKVLARHAGEVVAAAGWVERIRIVKEAEEVERIATAAALADDAFEHVLGIIGPGRTEAEIAWDLELYMRRNGAEGLAFPPIVASGPNGSRPHAKLSDRALEPGDLVTLDFGARLDAYCSDMTRTVAVGTPTEELRSIYETVLASNEAGLKAVGAGKTGMEIDAAARGVIETAGLGEHFGHGLGHGVGLEVHELPRLSPLGREVVPSGAVVTIEPGVYVPGVGGVRIEDLVVVDESGARSLTRSPKHLIEL